MSVARLYFLQHIMRLNTNYNLLMDLAISMNSLAIRKALELLGDKPNLDDFYKFFRVNLVTEERYMENPNRVKFCVSIFNPGNNYVEVEPKVIIMVIVVFKK